MHNMSLEWIYHKRLCQNLDELTFSIIFKLADSLTYVLISVPALL